MKLKKVKIKTLFAKELLLSGVTIKKTHPTQYNFLLGLLTNSQTFLNPWILKKSLRTFFLIFLALIKKKTSIVFFCNFDKQNLLKEFIHEARKKKIKIILKTTSINLNLLKRLKKKEVVFFSFFLNAENIIEVKNFTTQQKIPLISFSNQSINFFTSDFQILLGNFTSPLFQRSLLILLTLCLKKKKIKKYL